MKIGRKFFKKNENNCFQFDFTISFHFSHSKAKYSIKLLVLLARGWHWMGVSGAKDEEEKTNAKVENVMKVVGTNFYNFLDELFG